MTTCRPLPFLLLIAFTGIGAFAPPAKTYHPPSSRPHPRSSAKDTVGTAGLDGVRDARRIVDLYLGATTGEETATAEGGTDDGAGAADAKSAAADGDEECVIPEEQSETEKLLQQVKDAGVAGVISYAGWEVAFWAASVPVCVFGYREVTGHWPDFSDKEDMSKLAAEAFAFVNFARFAVPLRIGLALGTVPWVQENIVDRFMKKDDDDEINYCEEEQEPPAAEEAESTPAESESSDRTLKEKVGDRVGKWLGR